MSITSHRHLSLRTKRLSLLILLIFYSIALVYAGRYTVYHAHPELKSAEQASAILTKVGALIELPSGETPSMATITNAESLKTQQPFLVNAMNGDVLIVYQNAGIALLYRPSTNKLIAVGPVTNDQSAPQTSVSAPHEAPPAEASTTSHASSTP